MTSLRDKTYRSREPIKRILIVCEDTKSARYYFEGFCKEHKLENYVQVETCSKGNDPLSIVRYAKDNKKYYRKIYCVFDCDREKTKGNVENYKKALNACDGKNIIAINSVPSYEYWLLLHYALWIRPFVASGGGRCTVGEIVEKELGKYIVGYTKSAKDIYQKTKHLLHDAIKNATKVEEEQRKVQTDNPSTKIHLLIDDLKEAAKALVVD